MSWEIARDELLNNVVAKMTDGTRENGRRWVDLLGQTDKGKRLGACIVIDIRSGALTADIFASILDQLDFSKEGTQKDGCWAFHNAVVNHPANHSDPFKGRFVCLSGFTAESLPESDIYVRVLDLSDFISFVLDSNEHPMSALNQGDRERAKWMYFRGFDQPWEAIDTMWTGGMGRAFVTSLKDFNDLVENAVDPGHAVNDSLGLGMKGNLEFVAVQYAAGLQITSHQPTTLDSRWAFDNWYVSYKRHNGWGLTHQCSGGGREARERVHRALPNLSQGFSGTYVGIPQSALIENREKLLKDAFDRM